jgi:magnesium transporter
VKKSAIRNRWKRGLSIRRPSPPGSSPGTIVVDPDAPPPSIQVIAYGEGDLIEQEIVDPNTLSEFMGRWPVTWVNVDGLGDVELLQTLAAVFQIHPLELEDVVNVGHRPKLEENPEHLFVIAKMPSIVDHIHLEQVSIFVGRDFVLSFQERSGDCLDPVRQRLRSARGRIRGSGSDYLAYAILDALVDSYFPVLEQYAERLDRIEDEIVMNPSDEVLGRVHETKKDLLALRRSIWPLRDVLNVMVRDPSDFINETTLVYLRDIYDHVVQTIDLIENYREFGSNLTDYYLSIVSNRMNEVMKVLTIIATIFIPLTFIAGIYGMNFDGTVSPWNMPELRSYWGYPITLGAMVLLGVGSFLYFWHKGWIGSSTRPSRDETPGSED